VSRPHRHRYRPVPGKVEVSKIVGGVLSPLLSNLMLDELDRELERRGHRFVRYADDCNIYVRSRRAGERVMASVAGFLARRLKLRLNPAKSAVAVPPQRKFLGFSFTSGMPRRRIAPQALARFKSRVRELTRRTRGAGLAQIVEELSRYLVGWRGYFGFCETPSVLRGLDQWVRRRLRARACRKFLTLTARQGWRSTLPSGSGGPHDPECDCRQAEAPIQGRF